MKKSLLICLALLTLSPTVYSQYNFNNVSDSMIKKNHVAEAKIDVTALWRKKHYTYRTICLYDKEGTMVFDCNVYDTAKYKSLWSNRLIIRTNENPVTSILEQNWSGYHQFSLRGYDDNGRLITHHNFKRNGNLKNSSRNVFDDSLLSRVNHYNKRGKLIRYYEYAYSGDKMKTAAYKKGNGKLIKLWNYECDETGAAVKKTKDTMKVCKVTSYLADGTTVTTTNSFSWDGKPEKYIEYRDSNKNLLKFLLYEGKDEILTYKNINEYKNKKLIKYHSWYKDGKNPANYTIICKEFNLDGQMIARTDTVSRSRKLTINKHEFTFYENGLPFREKSYSNGKISYIYDYKYRYYDMKKD